MAVEITKEAQKFKWNTNSQTFQEFKKTWNEAEMAKVNAKISDTCKFAERLPKDSVVKKRDAIKVSDYFDKNFHLVPREKIRMAEHLNRVGRIKILDKFKVFEKSGKIVSIPHREAFKITERRKNSIGIKAYERLKLMEVYWDYINFVLSVAENLVIKEKSNKLLSLKRTERLVTVDKLSRDKLHVLKEKIAVKENLGNVARFNRLLSERIKAHSNIYSSVLHKQGEILHVSDLKANNLAKNQKEAFAISELFKKYVPVVRKIYETINVSDKVGKSSKISEKELLNIIDVLIRACEGVLSDVIIQKGGITLEEFLAAVETPSLHQPFTEFKVGEYEYKDALVRVVLQSTSREMNPSITACTMNVDIPDTDDRGTVKITNTSIATKVHFNRFYYNAPEVVVTLIGGSTSNGTVIPNIVSTELQDDEGRYFEVELLKTDGSRTTGTISWASKGY